jgi:hypothetical protein
LRTGLFGLGKERKHGRAVGPASSSCPRLSSVTESALAPANRAVSHVCDKCEAIDQKIEHY